LFRLKLKIHHGIDFAFNQIFNDLDNSSPILAEERLAAGLERRFGAHLPALDLPGANKFLAKNSGNLKNRCEPSGRASQVILGQPRFSGGWKLLSSPSPFPLRLLAFVAAHLPDYQVAFTFASFFRAFLSRVRRGYVC